MLELCPVSFAEACNFVNVHHRHHLKPVGHKFCIGVCLDNDLVGVAICGRPVARFADDGLTIEITRLCSSGVPNVCSMLYGACWRAAKALGYKKIITYILASESGISLYASGYKLLNISKGGSWCRLNRIRTNNHPLVPKLKFYKDE
jgi:hypothetical protein